MDKRTLILVRHGESVTNRSRTITGQSDAVLTRKGRGEAKRSAKYIKRKYGRQVDLIYSSPLSRALDTARLISRRVRIPVLKDDSLLEADYGRWEGKEKDSLSREREWKEYSKDPLHFSFPEGESIQNVKKRVLGLKSGLLLRDDWRCAVIVAHYTPIAFILLSVLEQGDHLKRTPFRIENASVSVIEITENGENLRLLNYKP